MSTQLSPFETANRRLDKQQSVVNAKRTKVHAAEAALSLSAIRRSGVVARLQREDEHKTVLEQRLAYAKRILAQAEAEYNRMEQAANRIIEGPIGATGPEDTGL